MSKPWQLVNFYLQLKGQAPPIPEILIRPHLRVAKDILELCADDLPQAEKRVQQLRDWARSRELDWNLYTVIKRWCEQDQGTTNTLVL